MINRYDKQILFKEIGLDGQKILSKSRICIVGIGALGTNISNLLARAGIGYLKLIDYDKVELSNLQRQTLFSENDVGNYKADVSLNKLSQINSEISIKSEKIKITKENSTIHLSNFDLIFDATDNFETRFIINDYCLKSSTPWVHSGVTASSGQSMLIIPGKTACYECLVNEIPDVKNFPTVHNSGIIASIVSIIASISVSTGIKYLIDKKTDCSLKYYDAWTHNFQKFDIQIEKSCKACSKIFNVKKTDI